MMLTRQLMSPWGDLLLLAEDGRLQGVFFADSAEAQAELARHAASIDSLGHSPAKAADRWVLEATAEQLMEYGAGRRHDFELPLLARGTPFQQRIWTALLAVPFGQTVTYGGLAALAGRPAAARAVGNAVGGNPWVIVVPCHRVLAGGGRLGGFSSGLERKRSLLRLEGIVWRE